VIRQGVVSAVKVFRNDINQFHVQLAPLSGCGNCASAGGCGLQVLPANQALLSLDCSVTCETPISVGDRVNVSLAEPERGWLRIVGMAYGFPTLGMIMGAALGYWVATVLQLTHARELISLSGFLLGLTGGLIAWDRAEKSTRCGLLHPSRNDTATIVGVVANSGEEI